MFVGDQHGRMVENVTDFNLSRDAMGPSKFTLTALNVYAKELQTVHKVANAAAPALKVKVKGHEAEEIKLKKDGFQRVVTLKWPDSAQPLTPEMMENLGDHIKQQLGPDTMVLCLPKDAELDIIELSRGRESESPQVTPHRDDAEWNF